MKQLFWCLILVFLFCLSTAVVISAGELENQLLEAIKRGDISSVRLLLDKGANVNALVKEPGSEHTALRMAAFHGNMGLVWLLIEKGARLNMKDDNGDTALSIAEKYESHDGPHETVRMLKAAGLRK
jgi:ankyrin repeat protein